MRRSLLLVALSCACAPETAVRPLPSADSGGLAVAGDTGDTAAAPEEGCALVDVQPRTAPVDAATAVTWTWRCAAPPDATGAWTLPLESGEVPVTAALTGETLTLSATLPADAPGVGRTDLQPPLRDGVPMADLAPVVRRHAPTAAVEEALEGAGWAAWAGAPAEARAFYLGDPDGNGNLDLFSYAVLANGDVVQQVQQADGQGTFRERRGLAHVEADGFTSAEALWMEGEDGALLSVIGATEPGQVAHVRKSTFVDRDWTETVLRVNHGFMGARVPDLLLAVEPEWKAPGELMMNLLGVVDRGDGPLGVYCEGTVCWEWSRIGPVTPDEVVAGVGFLGAFTDGELQGLQPADSHPRYWAADASDPGHGIVVQTIDYDYDTEVWAVVRSAVLPDPGFPVQAVSGAGGALDPAGGLDLVVELWGDGGWQAWLLRGALDKDDDRPPLLLGEAAHGALWASPAPADEGVTMLLPSTFTANGRALRSTRLLADGPSPMGARQALVRVDEWSLEAVLDGAATTAAPARSAVVGRADLSWAAGCATPDKAPLPACVRGMLPQGVAAAGVDGSTAPSDPPAGGDHLVVAPGEGFTEVVVGHGLHPAGEAPGTLVAAWAGASGPVTARLTAHATGLSLTVDGADWGPACHGRVSALRAGEDAALLAQTPGDCATGSAEWSVLSAEGAASLRLPADADGVAPLALAADTPAPVLWRDGAGQAWLGTVEADAWSAAPAPLGGAADPAALALGPDRPGAVWLSAPGETDWPAAPLEAWTEGPEVGEDAALVAVVPGGSGGCGWQVVAWPAGALDGEGVALHRSEDPTCADLPVPLAVARFDGAGQAVVSVSADGQVGLTRLVDGAAWHLDGPRLAVGAARATASSGDLDGDGLDDLLLSGLDDAPARALRGDGLGAFSAVAGETDAGVNLTGLAGPAPGQPAPTRAWDGTLPSLQRRVVPVTP